MNTEARVVLYVRAGCHLCSEARLVVTSVTTAFTEIDVDGDPALVARYGDQVPVVTVDDRQIGFWRIDPVRLRAAL